MLGPKQSGLTVAEALRQGESRLSLSDSARLDAELLLCHALSCGRAWLYTERHHGLESRSLELFNTLLQRRERGEPIAYIVGQREFWSLPLAVTSSTLIPRPETECVVIRCLELLEPSAAACIADLGTGSGAIALALASERPAWHITATDICPEACRVARQNAVHLGLSNVHVRSGHWLQALDSMSLDLIVSNPPYIAPDDPHLQSGDLRFEPTLALVSGADGLAALRTLCTDAGKHLQPGGWLVLEHGHDQATAVAALLAANGYMNVMSTLDLSGLERVTSGQWPGS
jgi:release factor glutamine methyltransferase